MKGMDLAGLNRDVLVRLGLGVAEIKRLRLDYASCWWCLVVHRSETPFFRVEQLHKVKKKYCCDEHLSEARSC